MTQVTYKTLFERYRDDSIILKAEQYAKWTLPQLMARIQLLSRERGLTVERDYQAIGALLVNNLAAKLAGLLFPHSRPFYKIDPSPRLKERAQQNGVKYPELLSNLARMEQDSCKLLFTNGSYDQLVMCMKNLIITGNSLLYRDHFTKKIISYGMQNYSVRRDGRGNSMDVVLREYADLESLPLDIQQAVIARNRGRFKPEKFGENTVEIYTRIQRKMGANGPYHEVSQEIEGTRVGKAGTFPEHLCPWLPLTWSLIIGENYGRGLVEDYAGDFAKLSDTSYAATLYGIELSKIINLVAPGQGANIDELRQAETGEYVMGGPESVHAYTQGDANVMQQLREEIADIFGRLARAFMYKGNTRDAERVTAFELRQDALEAETTLGGTYSSLSSSAQVPLAHILLTETAPGMLEGIITKDIKFDISAGLSALGRQADIQNLAAAAQEAAAIVPALAQIDPRFSAPKIVDAIMAGRSVDTESIFKDEDEQRADAQTAAQEAQGQAQIAAAQDLQAQSNVLQQVQG